MIIQSEKEQIAIENLKKEILIGEQKVRQLQSAQKQISAEVQEELNKKEWIISTSNDLTNKKAELETSVNELQTVVDNLRKEQSNLLDESASLDKKNNTVKADIIDQTNKINEKSSYLDIQIENHRQNVEKFVKEKADHEARVSRLKEAIK